MALVEAPRALDRDPEPVGGVEGDVRGLDRAAEHRGVQHVGQEAGLGEQLAAALGFGLALLGEPDVDPSGEEVELVPDALAVAEEDQRVGRGHCPMIATSAHRPRRRRAVRDWHHGHMTSGRSPVGQVTRGTTGTNRLRRVDRWIARHPALRRAADPLVVDLGFGASAVTALELHARLARARPDVEVARPRDRSRAASRGPRSARRGARGCDVVRAGRARVVRARRVRGADARGRRPAVIRAMNVLRQYDEAEVRRRVATDVRAARAGRPARRGHVRRARAHRARGSRSGRMPRPGRSRSRCGSPGWSIRRSRRSGCRRRSSTGTCPASACTRSWSRSTTSGSARPVCRRSVRCSAGRRALAALRTPAGRVQERARWRLGELTVPWSAVAPL